MHRKAPSLPLMSNDTEMEERATLAKQEVALVFPTKSAAAGLGGTENRPGRRTTRRTSARRSGVARTRALKGHLQDGWQKWKSQKTENSQQARGSGSAMDEKVQGLLTTLTRAVLRHQADLQLWRADTSFVIYDLYANGKVTMALKTALTIIILTQLKEQMEALQLDEAKLQRCKEAGWLGEGPQALDPAWFYHGWGAAGKCQLQAPVDPRPHTTILQDLDLAIRYLSMEGILLRFKCTKSLSEDLEGEVVPFMMTISMRTQEADDLRRIWMCMLQASGTAHQAGAGAAQSAEQTARAELPEPGLLRVEVAVGRSSEGLGLGLLRVEVAVGRSSEGLGLGLQLPLVRFSNPVGMNLCYANSAVQAWYWLRELSDSVESLQGNAQVGQRFFASAHAVLLTDCMSFRALWRGWEGITRQHDVGEFWQHL
eukprot:s6041_g1.t1